MKKLILHPGWSKTGTSAIQKNLFLNKETLMEQGILYPSNCQFADHAHHHFAMAFAGKVVGVTKKYTEEEAISLIMDEYINSNCDSMLISSELMPFMPKSENFNSFAKNFDRIEVIFTIRNQIDLLISLYNQLIKDANVRYRHSLFNLFIRNIRWLNYNEKIKRWENSLGRKNIRVLVYSTNVVNDFIRALDIPELDNSTSKEHTNKSLPVSHLKYIQNQLSSINDREQYKATRDCLLESLQSLPLKNKGTLLSVEEQKSILDHYKVGNRALSKRYRLDTGFFEYKPKNDIFSYE